MKVISIVGARPQFIKLAPFSREIRKQNTEVIIHTGQHFDHEMSNLFFNELAIPKPKKNLNIHSGNHGSQTGRMIIELEKELLTEKPDAVVIFGDTNSTLASSVACSKLHIPSIHIEAGLRSFNRKMPEEINRVISDHTSDLLFAPTESAMDNLAKEGLQKKSFLTGDIMVDSLQLALEITENRSSSNIPDDDYYLLTLHRPYNVDDTTILKKILSALSELKGKVIFAVHPRTRKKIEENNFFIGNNIQMIKPVGYIEFVQLQKYAHKIITDSGGIQKEAYILRRPCITLRPETEWVDTVKSGWNLLLNPQTEKTMAGKIKEFMPSDEQVNIFGKNVASRMVEIINKKVV
ncbi:MAG: UDP-N-acetylglucosamine 2-epimerase (non-hydrolyzing) [Cyclobacteriaceae bacterium]